jgi:hypothetical protein
MIKPLNRPMFIRFLAVSSLVVLALAYVTPSLVQKTVVSVQGSFSVSTTDQNNNDKDNEDELSVYENPALGFRLKYPGDFRIAEVTNSLKSKTIVFEKVHLAPATGAFLSINATNWDIGITFDELRKVILDIIRTGPGTSILENNTAHISGIPIYKIVQSHTNSPYGRDAISIFIGAVRDKTSYIISSLSTDIDALQKMIDSFEFMR